MALRNKSTCCSRKKSFIDLACHFSNLSMQVSSGTQNIPSPNEQSYSTKMMSFCLVIWVGGVSAISGSINQS
ncbi:hypothetical protein TNCV_4213751 [Trichonephila clavipes]|nr:hypothetical protein TNCV_4213751 [Trichonephila clavipes]